MLNHFRVVYHIAKPELQIITTAKTAFLPLLFIIIHSPLVKMSGNKREKISGSDNTLDGPHFGPTDKEVQILVFVFTESF